jgi:hypothetical protein
MALLRIRPSRRLGAVVAAAAVAAGALLASSAAPASAGTVSWRWQLHAGQSLQPGQELINYQAGERLVMQKADGNLVLYRGRSAVWQSRTHSSPSGADLSLQRSDGNLVVYTGRRAGWQSHTYPAAGDRVVLQGDGNLVVYNSKGRALWSTGTERRARATASSLANPASNWPESSAYLDDCFVAATAGPCNTAALSMIDAARRSEGLGALRLPADFWGIGPAAQLVDVINAERTSRGLRALSDAGALNTYAWNGAVRDQDPNGPNAYSWGSVWAGDYVTPLAADFAWVYFDGPGGSNLDCSAANHSGCWGHRDVILSRFGSGAMGTASAEVNGSRSITALLVDGW